jgi:hypothetical protein
MKKGLLLIIIIVGAAFTALNIHIIQFDDGFKFLKKATTTLTDTYVDARGFNKVKILSKPALIEAGIKELME